MSGNHKLGHYTFYFSIYLLFHMANEILGACRTSYYIHLELTKTLAKGSSLTQLAITCCPQRKAQVKNKSINIPATARQRLPPKAPHHSPLEKFIRHPLGAFRRIQDRDQVPFDPSRSSPPRYQYISSSCHPTSATQRATLYILLLLRAYPRLFTPLSPSRHTTNRPRQQHRLFHPFEYIRCSS